jgi:putative peptidoglycan lipid II flippase
VARAAGVVSGLTLLSRLLGYVRDMVVASLFGAGLAADAFFIAFSIPNLLRRLFGEGSLSIAFVPVFSDWLNRRGRDQADQLAASAFWLMALLLLAAVAAGVLWAPQIVHLIAYGWSGDPQKIALCVALTRIMLPYVIFIGLTALCMAILNVMDHFAAPAFAPVLLNVAMISAAIGASFFTRDALVLVQWLALGVLVGGVLQLGLQMPVLIRRQIRVWRSIRLWHPALGQVARLFLPVLFGTAVFQINTLVIRFLASLLPQGSVSYLYYADRLFQFPLGLFGLAAATAVLPALSRHASLQQWDELRNTFGLAVRLVLFVSLPAMAGLVVLREPIVALLFQRGAFDFQATRLTADALLFYATGLWAVSILRIVLNCFYALQQVWTPTLIGVLSVGANLMLGWVLMGPMQHNGLALALSLASMFNVCLLILVLRRRLGALGWRRIARSTAGSAGCAALMGLGIWWLSGAMLPPIADAGVIQLLIGLLVCIMVGVALFGALAYMFRLPELNLLLNMAIKRNDSP